VIPGARTLSVVMPCYNELPTVDESVKRVLESPWVRELIIVDDGSTDGTSDVLDALTDERVRVFHQARNRGKGAALSRGFREATAEFVIIQDADLEYDPRDYEQMLGPLVDGRADVVFGSRFISDRPHAVLYFWHYVGNRFLTLVSNVFSNLNLTDMNTCYKAFRREVLDGVTIEEPRFGVDPELTAKVARSGWRVYEVGISYSGRTYAEGKKIGWRDGFRALWAIVRYSVLPPALRRRRGRDALTAPTRRGTTAPSNPRAHPPRA
jgi:glycosyltransferase involved in cell wall biosynthesis